ncbi:MAG: hypothetical protein JAZ17_22805 [Candidatus Thiodiazotropha endolucinida]|nr:hypothetical protein [Candidatus Thiodiazotropha endolucinida]
MSEIILNGRKTKTLILCQLPKEIPMKKEVLSQKHAYINLTPLNPTLV